MTDFHVGCGLLNLWNSCFLNATLQALFHVPKVATCFQLEASKIPGNKCKKQEKCVTCKVLMLFKNTRNDSSPCSAGQLYNELRKTNGPVSKLINGRMQDAHEFLELLAEQMERDNHTLKWFETIFVGDIRILVQCSVCENICETSGLLGDIVVDLGHKSIQTALDAYFAWEPVNGYECECCQKKVAAKKRHLLLSSSSCLCITLKRFSDNRKKINRNIQITPQLSTTVYFDGNLVYKRDCEYKLKAVINHVGQTSDTGHYTTTVCSPNDEFYEFDDTNVRKLNGNAVKEGEAYILFYECIKESCEDENQLQREFLYDEHEVNLSGNSLPRVNSADLLEWVGAEVEIVDNSDLFLEAREVALPSIIHALHTKTNDHEAVQVKKSSILSERLYTCSDTESENENAKKNVEDVTETESENETQCRTPFEPQNDTDTDNETENEAENSRRNVSDQQSEIDSEKETQCRTPFERNQNDTDTDTETEIETEHSRRNVSVEDVIELSGRRIVDINHFRKQMQLMSRNNCKKCEYGVMVFDGEIQHVLRSIFKFRCTACGTRKRVESCEKSNTNKANIKDGSISGIVSIGLGHYHLQEFLAHLNIPSMSYPSYHKIDREFQKNVWRLAKMLEEECLQDEIRIAKETGQVDSAGNALISVEFDGSWGKRSYGKNYASLSGCAAIIGLRTNKILYSDVKSKYCHICTIAKSKNTPPNRHDCNKNYDGPSSGMETQIVVEGYIHCATKGARFTKYVGDGDSSTYKALRDLRLYKDPELEIEKFECVNHLFRNFWKKFDDLLDNTKFCRRGRKLLSSSLGGDICVGIRKAAEYWRNSDVDSIEKCTNLEQDILNAPLHYLGVHENCRTYFCDKSTDPSVKSTISILKDTGVFYEILDLCQNYFANKAKSLIANMTTNKVEGFNSLIAKTLGGKRVCNDLAASYDSRTAVSSIQHNTGGHFGSKFHEFVYGQVLDSCVKLENTRKRKLKTNASSQN